jgi:hypothetical protein
MTVTPTGAEAGEGAGAGVEVVFGGSSTARGGQSSSSAMAADERWEQGKLEASRMRGGVGRFCVLISPRAHEK